MYITIEIIENGFITRMNQESSSGEYQKQEVRVYSKSTEVIKYLTKLFESEKEKSE